MAHSLYVRGLPDKLPKEDLKRNLYMLFATYGVILDVVALKTMKMRGQAHIVFRDLDASTQAMRALQGFTFFGKDMVCLSFPTWLVGRVLTHI
jgi:U2 small nuclear ribonucleoprotein B''